MTRFCLGCCARAAGPWAWAALLVCFSSGPARPSPSPLPAGEGSGEGRAELLILYTGDTRGYVDPCG